jgi:hypothetical protein
MAHRRRKRSQSISLFPFLSILACVIGTLTLMITALALGQMDNDTVASAEKYERARRMVEQTEALIERLKAEIATIEAGADETRRQLADAIVELERLKRLKESLLARIDDERKPDVELPDVDPEKHKQRIAQIREELAAQEEERTQLAAELEKLGVGADEAEVIIRPGGSGVDLEPTFIECTASDIVVYDGEPWRVRRADLGADEKLAALFERIAAAPKATAIFLVRDDALATFHAASAVARTHRARHGKLPVIGHGKIDLSVFEK